MFPLQVHRRYGRAFALPRGNRNLQGIAVTDGGAVSQPGPGG